MRPSELIIFGHWKLYVNDIYQGTTRTVEHQTPKNNNYLLLIYMPTSRTCRRCVDVDVSGETGFIRRFVRGFAARPYDKYQKISTRQNEAARIVTGATK